MDINAVASSMVRPPVTARVDTDDMAKKVKQEVEPVKAVVKVDKPATDDAMKTRGKLLDIRV